jgi:hypothetical protein
MIVFHVVHQFLTAEEIHFKYSIYVSLQRFDLIFDDLQRINLDFLIVNVLLESAHVVLAFVGTDVNTRASHPIVLITLLLYVVLRLLHSHYYLL